MRRKRWTAALLAVMLLLVGLPSAMAAESETARAKVVFAASEPDADGRFTMDFSIANARFHAFQFVLRYDKTTVVPVSAKNGTETEHFFDFAEKSTGTDWMATVGTGIDTKRQLIDFTGYVTPGDTVAVGRPEIIGEANLGDAGLTLFHFHFKKVGTDPVKLEIASNTTAGEFQEYLPDGGGLSLAGSRQAATITVQLPEKLGTNTSVDTAEPTLPKSEKTREQRLKDTVILQIGNSHASVAGTRTAIYKDEPNVTAYAADNRTYVPVRFIAEQMGAKVDWEQKTSTVVITKDKKVIRMPLDSKTYTVDGVSKEMDVTPQLKGEPGSATQRTMVPIRFVAEALKMDVQWDKDSNTVIIAPASAPWDLKGTVERGILMDTLLILSPLVETVVGT